MDLKYVTEEVKKEAEKGTCLRLKVGALLVKNNKIISRDHNTSVTGTKTCKDEGKCLLNDEGRCYRTIHAEVNAILKVSPVDRYNSTLVVSHQPCENCSKLIAQTGIREVYYLKEYANDLVEKLQLNTKTYQI